MAGAVQEASVMELVCGFPKGRPLSGDTTARHYPGPVSCGLRQRRPASGKTGSLLTDHRSERFRTVCLQPLVFSGGGSDNLGARGFPSLSPPTDSDMPVGSLCTGAEGDPWDVITGHSLPDPPSGPSLLPTVTPSCHDRAALLGVTVLWTDFLNSRRHIQSAP